MSFGIGISEFACRHLALETFYDYARRGLDFEAFYQLDYASAQGLAFVVYVVDMVHAEVASMLAGTRSRSRAVVILSGAVLVRERGRPAPEE